MRSPMTCSWILMRARKYRISATSLLGGLFFLSAFTSIMGLPASAFADDARDRRQQIEQQIAALEKEAAEFDDSLARAQKEARTLANEKSKLEIEVKRRELEIRRLTLALQKAALEIQQKSSGINDFSTRIGASKKALGASLFLLYASDQDSALEILLKNKTLSDFFSARHNIGRVQSNIKEVLGVLKDNRTQLTQEKEDLEDYEEEQQSLKALQEVERKLLAQKKKEKEELLRLTKGKEEIFQKLLTSKKRDIATLRTQLYYLEKTGVTAEEAVHFADLAAQRTGIRTAFLLALLEVETGKQFEDGVISVGTNLGTGNWKRDMYECFINLGKKGTAEAEKNAFMKITGKLGLDPDRMPVSRKPNYGCGGAMGPAQFLPTTWLRFEDQVASVTGHRPPSPWSTEDAFTAAATFLADAGARAQSVAGEIAAAKTYLSGNPLCTRSICRYYSDRVVALAREIERIL